MLYHTYLKITTREVYRILIFRRGVEVTLQTLEETHDISDKQMYWHVITSRFLSSYLILIMAFYDLTVPFIEHYLFHILRGP